MNPKSTRLILFFGIFITIYIHQSIACSCIAPPPPNIAFQNATAVFMGVVDTIKNETQYGFPLLKVIFTIDKSWKGTNSKSVFVFTASSEAACGYGFTKGGKYLVYCYGTIDTLRTGLCNRTKRDFEASEDLAYLMTLGVKEISDGSTIPKELLLLQNYPNPANPSTVFRFNLPKSSIATLHLFNLLGQNVTEIYSGYVHEGSNEINWNGSQIPSGIYFARLQTQYGVKTIKTLLVK
ncbi:MAG: T9SS type A sorting domain-containing protein [Bacteroidota bacterium]